MRFKTIAGILAYILIAILVVSYLERYERHLASMARSMAAVEQMTQRMEEMSYSVDDNLASTARSMSALERVTSRIEEELNREPGLLRKIW